MDQQFLVSGNTYAVSFISLDVTVNYYDAAGTAYTDKFTISIYIGGSGTGVYATATPTGVKSSQLVITSYAVSVDPLQPGETFTLTMTVQNMGNAKAQRITMIVGGGSSGSGGGGTPVPGGVSGGSGEFTNFAPVGASNIQSLGDLDPGGATGQTEPDRQYSTNPGAYPMKVTFSYTDRQGQLRSTMTRSSPCWSTACPMWMSASISPVTDLCASQRALPIAGGQRWASGPPSWGILR